MKIIKPIVDLYRNIGMSGNTIPSLISTTVDNEYDDWNPSTGYIAGDIVNFGFLKYTAVQDSTNEQPDTPASTFWSALGYSNKYAMFNGATTSPTVQDGSDFVVEVSGNGVNAMSFFRLNADSIRIEMIHPTLGTVYDKTYEIRLNTIGVVDYYEYFFLPYADFGGIGTTLVVTDIPPFLTTTIRVTLSSISDVSVGLMSYGMLTEIATVDYGTSLSINDYSTKETNDFSDTVIVERPFTDKVEFDFTVPRSKVFSMKRILAEYRAIPITVVGVEEEEGTIIYGFIDDFDITYTDFSTADGTLTIEGL